MSLYSDYAELDDLKRYLRVPGVYEGTYNTEEDVVDDIPLGTSITAASRAIDNATNRQFGLMASTSAMIYTPEWDAQLGRNTVQIDDLMTTSGLVITARTSATGSYDTTVSGYSMWPFNAAAKGKPWTHIVFDPGVSVYRNVLGSLSVTAKYGWTSVPETIKAATLVQASRFYKRRDAAFGIAGSPELGNEIRLLAKLDPDVAVMVSPYKRWWGAK